MRWVLIQTRPIGTRKSRGLSYRLQPDNIMHKRRTDVLLYRVKPNAKAMIAARKRSGMIRRRWALSLGFEWAGNVRDIEVGKCTLSAVQWGHLLKRAMRLAMARTQHIPT